MSRASQSSIDKEKIDSPVPIENVEAQHIDIDPAFERETIRKVDRHLLPILSALYSLSLIDRTNISNARVSGAAVDLELTVGERYSIITLVFFISYIILELPSNLVLRRVGTANWLSLIAVLWGTIMICMGFTKTWTDLLICRFFLGALEAGFFPGCVFLVSVWYVRREVQKRMAAFYLLSVLVSGFSSIVASGLAEIGGHGTYNGAPMKGWRWIFIIEGAVTVLFGVISYFVIVDFPDKNTFLTAEQTALVKARVEKDRGDSEYDALTWNKISTYAMDLKLWGFAFMFAASTMPSYAFSYFTPVILQGMGYSSRNSQLLTAPPYVFAVIVAFGLAVIADKYNKRAPIMAFQAIMCIVGLMMTAYHHNNAVRYAGVFFGIAGATGNVPAVLAYQSINIIGQSKRSFSSALIVGFGGIGGICASVAFRQVDAPRYERGLWATAAFQFCILIILAVTSTFFHIRNNQVRNGSKNYIEGRPGFYYTL